MLDALTPRVDASPTTSWRTQLVSPQTLVLFVIVANVILTTPTRNWLTWLALGLVGIALAVMAPPKLTAGWLVFVGVALVLHLFLPTWFPSSATVLIGFVAMWMLMFAGIFAAFVAGAFALDVHQLGATLTQMRAPRWIYVPVMVVARFFPIALRDLRAIVEAMSLRGLTPGAWSALRHPLRTGEYVLIPFLASAARVADELTAAATIKGLGAPTRRTSWVTTRFRVGDAVLLAVCAGLVGARVWQAMP